jgi:hypothetical protein
LLKDTLHFGYEAHFLMTDLFRIETDRVTLWWRITKSPSPSMSDVAPPPGLLSINARRSSLSFGPLTWRQGLEGPLATDPTQQVGPRLHEQTDYQVYVRSKDGSAVEISHRDPLLLRDLSTDHDSLHGVINFKSQVGLTDFSLWVAGEREVDFTVEVFPTKLDYKNDYDQLLAEIQEILTGLALEYLSSTYRLGFSRSLERTTELEWLILLEHIIETLERAVIQVSRQPRWGTQREPVRVRVEKVRRPDGAMRRAILRAGGRESVLLDGRLIAQGRIDERRARLTLDTQEHRWLAAQLSTIRRRLTAVRKLEMKRERTLRTVRVTSRLDRLEQRMVRLGRLEPISAATQAPAQGFVSLQLLSTPGYREAYRDCMILSQGLSLTGDAVKLSLKNLNVLYEYWCYLTLLRVISKETGRPIQPSQVLALEQQGLRVTLQKGREQTVEFSVSSDCKVTATYNPRFSGKWFLLSQQPDYMITVENSGWPRLSLVLDAKYRVDATPEYTQQFGAPGPPEDALNVLHRYRDAILEQKSELPLRRVIQSVALFPYHEMPTGSFEKSRLWRALDHLGVGAIPLLPGGTEYLSHWVRRMLRLGGWSLADRGIPHAAHQRLMDWRIAAAEPVLVGVLKAGLELEHRNWVADKGCYYTPLTKQRRLHSAKCVALYLPSALRSPGAVALVANVLAVRIVKRKEIATPWSSSRPDQLQVLYELDHFRQMDRPIQNLAGQRFSGIRWTSSLALLRSKRLEELLLETEPEWRLYELLVASEVEFKLVPEAPRLLQEDPMGRAWFVIETGRIQYQGADGFAIELAGLSKRYVATVEEVGEALGLESS